jgi:hypothetical protein
MDILAECLSRTIPFPSRRHFWPPKSPEMTAYDFCLCGALKVRVLQTYSAMLVDKHSGKACQFFTGKAIEVIIPTLRVDKCIDCESGRITAIVFNIQRSCVLLPHFPTFLSIFISLRIYLCSQFMNL